MHLEIFVKNMFISKGKEDPQKTPCGVHFNFKEFTVLRTVLTFIRPLLESADDFPLASLLCLLQRVPSKTGLDSSIHKSQIITCTDIRTTSGL